MAGETWVQDRLQQAPSGGLQYPTRTHPLRHEVGWCLTALSAPKGYIMACE